MIYAIAYKISKHYNEDAPYFFQKQTILLVAGAFIYFLLMNVDAFKVLLPFYSLIIPLDLYLLDRYMQEDRSSISLRNLNDNDSDNDENQLYQEDKLLFTEKKKMKNMISKVYEYLKHKNEIKVDALDVLDIGEKLNNKELLESNYQPNTIELCETMEHTLDNIINREKLA
jgi:hypothetical protein